MHILNIPRSILKAAMLNLQATPQSPCWGPCWRGGVVVPAGRRGGPQAEGSGVALADSSASTSQTGGRGIAGKPVEIGTFPSTAEQSNSLTSHPVLCNLYCHCVIKRRQFCVNLSGHELRFKSML